MKKIIITRENYEELMFDLLEGKFDAPVSANLIDQIEADTYLNFEWKQWEKARFSESINAYKLDEAEFIESLTREEGEKKVWTWRVWPYAVAASLILLIGLYVVLNSDTNSVNEVYKFSKDKKELPAKIDKFQDTLPGKETVAFVHEDHKAGKLNSKAIKQPKKLMAISIDSSYQIQKIAEHTLPKEENKLEQTIQDSIKFMIAEALSKPRYKITITEGPADASPGMQENVVEKRYTMIDVLNKKDGISLSKFLHNSKSRLVTDPDTKRTTIEYVASDHSILVLTLSN